MGFTNKHGLDAYVQLFNFKDLLHFSLSVHNIPFEFDQDHVGPLVSLIQASPRLQSLSLDFHDEWSGELQWSPETIFSALGVDAVYPALASLRLLGAFSPDWWKFFEEPESDPLRTFISRHPGLRTVGFGWVTESAYSEPIEPMLIVKLFPCLEHLTAPAFICGPVLASELANSLQSLAVTDERYDSTGPNLETMAMAARLMPQLKRLVLHAQPDDDGPVSTATLNTLLSAMPFLEDLELNTPLDHPENFTNLLKLIPNLSNLTNSRSMLILGEEDSEVSQWHNYILNIARDCPQLSQFNLDSDSDHARWGIRRASGGEITVSLLKSAGWM
ncbi:hypothetical protein BDV93DRAFT_611307 [Ceratobasidium sp. AG-I]|nr:hypothetical protein BDV93DRAFT_611307 [Ceratobasidium sp. AG-I]